MQTVSDAAMKDFQSNNFEKAAKGFEEAYQIYPQPVLMKNATVAWYSYNQCEDADRTGVQYLKITEAQEAEFAKDRRDVMTVIVRCRIRVATVAFNNDNLDDATQILEGIELYLPLKDEAQKLAELRKNINMRQAEIEANKGDSNEQSTKGNVVTPSTVPPPSKGLLYAGWGLVGGAALFGIGQAVYVNTVGQNKINANPECTQTVDGEECDEIKNMNATSAIVGTAAGVVGATGLTLLVVYYVKKNKHDKTQSVTFIPEVSPDRAGASVLIRF